MITLIPLLKNKRSLNAEDVEMRSQVMKIHPFLILFRGQKIDTLKANSSNNMLNMADKNKQKADHFHHLVIFKAH